MLFHLFIVCSTSFVAIPHFIRGRVQSVSSIIMESFYDYRFDNIATLEFYNASYAKEITTLALSPTNFYDPSLPRSTAYMLKINGVVRVVVTAYLLNTQDNQKILLK